MKKIFTILNKQYYCIDRAGVPTYKQKKKRGFRYFLIVKIIEKTCYAFSIMARDTLTILESTLPSEFVFNECNQMLIE